ncbi:MAG: hypothetical protein ACI87W_002389, partial [Halieaceae bacterium]
TRDVQTACRPAAIEKTSFYTVALSVPKGDQK